MLLFGVPQQDRDENNWRRKLDKFIKANQQEIAALAWGLLLERGKESDQTLGIDIEPTPHFVYCSREAIETLNRNVKDHIQEILGVLDAHDPEKEVVIISIGEGQVKMIQFEPELPLATCFEQVATDVDTLLERLEKRMKECI
ncbi:hypothetical protein PN499_00370 [Kamptonema animale CS-326]|jgi:hypothetical protein|uniref:beta-carboxysome assembly chaperone CcmS n=1 Tax=Kamptonema animale TaxID=92934 RepID=UPI00232E4B39|nr:hypothetical protein [Kamptonema animale]MDB9509659.1 hypothetical protein [Kamptonema animale CS-326]